MQIIANPSFDMTVSFPYWHTHFPETRVIIVFFFFFFIIKCIFFLCIETAPVKFISKVYGGQSPESGIWLYQIIKERSIGHLIRKLQILHDNMSQASDFSIWCVRLQVQPPAHAPRVWCVQKIAPATAIYDTYCPGHWNEENEKKIKNVKLNSYHFSLTFS